ncbi:MAG: hypothetical protein ACJAR3_003096 [Roseivirga sp.]
MSKFWHKLLKAPPLSILLFTRIFHGETLAPIVVAVHWEALEVPVDQTNTTLELLEEAFGKPLMVEMSGFQ